MKKIKIFINNFLKFIISIYFLVYLFFYAPYYNYKYALEHGFLKWVLFREFVPTIKALIFPYYEFFKKSNNLSINQNKPKVKLKAISQYYPITKKHIFSLSLKEKREISKIFLAFEKYMEAIMIYKKYNNINLCYKKIQEAYNILYAINFNKLKNDNNFSKEFLKFLNSVEKYFKPALLKYMVGLRYNKEELKEGNEMIKAYLNESGEFICKLFEKIINNKKDINKSSKLFFCTKLIKNLTLLEK